MSDELDSNSEAIVLSAKDYYPFGMSMPGRGTEGGSYRYGFNGKETDPETDIQDYALYIKLLMKNIEFYTFLAKKYYFCLNKMVV